MSVFRSAARVAGVDKLRATTAGTPTEQAVEYVLEGLEAHCADFLQLAGR